MSRLLFNSDVWFVSPDTWPRNDMMWQLPTSMLNIVNPVTASVIRTRGWKIAPEVMKYQLRAAMAIGLNV